MSRYLIVVLMICGLLTICSVSAEEPSQHGIQGATTGAVGVKGTDLTLDGNPARLFGIRTAGAIKDARHYQASHRAVGCLQGPRGQRRHGLLCRVQRRPLRIPSPPMGRRWWPGTRSGWNRSSRPARNAAWWRSSASSTSGHRWRLKDADAVRTAVRTVANALQGHENVILNIANEQNSGAWSKFAKVYDFRKPENIIELCQVVHRVDPKRVVGGGGYDARQQRSHRHE